MVYIRTRKIATGAALTESATTTIDVDRAAYIQSIELVTRCTESSASAGYVARGMEQFYSNVNLEANGSYSYFNVSSKALYQMSVRDYGALVYVDTIGASDSSASKRATFFMDTRFNPKNPYDFSSLIPAHRLSSLKLKLTLPAWTTIGGVGASLTSPVVDVIITEVVPETDEEDKQIAKGLKAISVVESTNTISATAAGYGTNRVDFPTGRLIKDCLLRTQVSSADSDALFESVKVQQLSPKDATLYENTWYGLKNEDTMQHSVEGASLATGFSLVDFVYKLGGLNTVGLKQGDVKFDFINATNTGTVATIYRSYI